MARHTVMVQVLLMVLLVGRACNAAEPRNILVVGIVPQQSAVELARQWGPLLAYLEEKTGESLRFETAKDIPTFEERLAAGRYDIVYCNPFQYAQRSRVPGYAAFAREKGVRLQGLVVVAVSSQVRSLDDLAGARLAFPAPTAFAAAMLPLAHLKARGVPVTPLSVGTHDSVYLGVARGFFPAGGGIRRTFDNCPLELRGQLRIVWESPPYTPHPLAAHPRVPRDSVKRIRQALLAMDGDPGGREILARLRMQGFEAGSDRDWNDVRALNFAPPADFR